MEENTTLGVVTNYSGIDKYQVSKNLPIPKYLQETYWWAYVHPTAVQIFERQWLVNLILWGNFARLRNAALDEIGCTIEGESLQIACVYGDFSQQIAARLTPESELHIVDIAPVQLENVSKKIQNHSNVHVHHQDSTSLNFDEGKFDNVIVFFLLHEQPESVRAKTVEEAMRVVKPGGKVIFVDYHRPHWSNPFRYIMVPILHFLEPFALDVWRKEIIDWVPKGLKPKYYHKETMFGGLYQKVVMTR
jgi:ubiquinone/menaquinone biosynthesis C-methylase UbiE